MSAWSEIGDGWRYWSITWNCTCSKPSLESLIIIFPQSMSQTQAKLTVWGKKFCRNLTTILMERLIWKRYVNFTVIWTLYENSTAVLISRECSLTSRCYAKTTMIWAVRGLINRHQEKWVGRKRWLSLWSRRNDHSSSGETKFKLQMAQSITNSCGPKRGSVMEQQHVLQSAN